MLNAIDYFDFINKKLPRMTNASSDIAITAYVLREMKFVISIIVTSNPPIIPPKNAVFT